MTTSTHKWKRRFVIVTLGLLLLFTFFFYVDTVKRGDATGMAIAKMAMGLVLVWVVGAGYLIYRFRGKIRGWMLSRPGSWKKKFVIFATALALLEEVVTVTMTNLAPAFGVPMGAAYITASANFFDVVLFHSVIVFIPLFFATAKLLEQYAFSPFAVFLFFGILGTLVEGLYSGGLSLLMFPQWLFVYGLMVYLPAYSIPKDRGAREPRFWNYLTAIPYILLRALPYIILIAIVIRVVLGHPDIHFAPM